MFQLLRSRLLLRPYNQRFSPFVSVSLDEYLQRYWAVVFTVASRPDETTQMRLYLSWYCTRGKVVELNHHIHAEAIRRCLLETTGTAELPVLFVNKRFVGDIAAVRELERKRLLKDLFQFGFMWKTTADCSNGLPPLPSAHNDADFFRARYRGTPIAKPVVQLPCSHPSYVRK